MPYTPQLLPGFSPVGGTSPSPTNPNLLPGFSPVGGNEPPQLSWTDKAKQYLQDQGKQIANQSLGQTIYQDPSIQGAIGVAKGVGDTVLGGAQLVNKGIRAIPGAADYVPAMGSPDETVQGVTGNPNASLEANGVAQNVGKGMEGVAEFILGDEALKGLSIAKKLGVATKVAELAEKSPMLAKALEIGMNATRQGTVGGAQALTHGATPGEAAETAALTGGTGAALEGVASGVDALKSKFDNPSLLEKGNDLVESLAGGQKESSSTVVNNVQDELNQWKANLGTSYDRSMQAIAKNAEGIKIKLKGSALQKTAQDLLSDSEIPTNFTSPLKGIVPDSARLEPFLKELADGQSTHTWDEIEATRQKLGQTIRKLPFDSPIKSDLIQLRKGIDQTLEDAATKANKPELADNIKKVRSFYAQGIQRFEQNAIQRLVEKNPNSVADVLLNKESKFNANTLFDLLSNGNNIRQVQADILDNIIKKSVEVDGEGNQVLNGRTLKRTFDKLGSDVKSAVWNPNGNANAVKLSNIQSFIDAAAKRQPNELLSFLLKHKTAAIGGGALGLGSLSAGHKAFQGDFTGAVKDVGKGAALAAIGTRLANPAFLESLVKALNSAPVRQGIPAAVASSGATHFFNHDTKKIESVQ